MKRSLILVLGSYCCTMCLLPIASANAAALDPPAPPETTCKITGRGTECKARLTTTYSFSGEFTCGPGDSFDVDEAGTTDRDVVYLYDTAGNLTKRITRVSSLLGAFTNATTGASVPESGHFTITHRYLTPGDESTDQTTFDGVFAKVVLPGSGIVLQDAGHLIFAADGHVVRYGGHHQFQDAELEELCAALS